MSLFGKKNCHVAAPDSPTETSQPPFTANLEQDVGSHICLLAGMAHWTSFCENKGPRVAN